MKRILIVIFTVTTVILFGFSMLTATKAIADNGYKGKGNQKELQQQRAQNKEYRKHQEKVDRRDRKHYAKQNGRYHSGRQDYHNYSGYRERPYDRDRYYVNYNHKGRRYDYNGHWRSWEQFDRYAKKHPEIYKHGGYYHQSSHLMFRFCEPDSGSCFFFSIGG